MDLPTLALLDSKGPMRSRPPDEWWLAVDDGSARRSSTAACATAPIGSRSVDQPGRSGPGTCDRPRRARDHRRAAPSAFIAAAVFAIVGFVVSAAVSARERVTEFALLRALGLSRRPAVGLAVARERRLAAISLVAGTGLGLRHRLGRPAVRDRHPGAITPVPAGRARRAVDAPSGCSSRLSVVVLAVTVGVAGLAAAPARAGVGPPDGRGLTCAW